MTTGKTPKLFGIDNWHHTDLSTVSKVAQTSLDRKQQNGGIVLTGKELGLIITSFWLILYTSPMPSNIQHDLWNTLYNNYIIQRSIPDGENQ